MRLHCLGTAGYHANDQRQTSCYFLPASGIVLDAGSGLYRLAGRIETDTLDLFLSHAHLDHVIGLTYLLEIMHRNPLQRLTIWGEGEKLAAIREHLFAELLFPVTLQAQWQPLDGRESVCLGGTKIYWRTQTHPGGSLAYRLDWPDQSRRLVYATDTCGDHNAEVLSWMKDADLLMHECYFRDRDQAWAEATGHSWTQRVADVATATNPRRLLLTHLNPLEASFDPQELAAIRNQYAGELIVAADGLVVEF